MTSTDSFVIRLFHVEYHGDPETFCLFLRKLHNRNPQNELRSTVTTASPVINTRSLVRKKATWPGECPGVGVKFKPGQKTLMHSHPDHVIYVLKDGKLKITLPDGTINEVSLKAGQAIWMNAQQHSVENLGKTEASNLVIELKK
jgi:quercetin dioxygenase-like cupin family protein